jgi:hypothetical protein
MLLGEADTPTCSDAVLTNKLASLWLDVLFSASA